MYNNRGDSFVLFLFVVCLWFVTIVGVAYLTKLKYQVKITTNMPAVEDGVLVIEDTSTSPPMLIKCTSEFMRSGQ